jgi:4-hydroxy-tetrahydrodipicolinate synthase
VTFTPIIGTIVPLVTPFDADEVFDPPAMRRLIQHVLEQGADGLMPTALTGEGPLLTTDETVAVWETVFAEVAERRPVVPAVISTTTRRAVELVRRAEALGAAGVLAAPILPELYSGRSTDDVVAFYADLAAASSLPITLFNYPSLTGIDFTAPVIERLVRIESVRSIKESTGDTRRVHSIQRLVGDRLEVICGAPNVALESLALGCRTWITGIMNVVPRSAQQLMQAVVQRRDLALARRVYYRQILPLVDILLGNNNPTGTIKAGVEARGVHVGAPRRPGHTVGADDRRRLERLAVDLARSEAESAARMTAS